MPRFMLPRYVEVVDDLPRTEASMRVRKHEIRARGVTDDTYDREPEQQKVANGTLVQSLKAVTEYIMRRA